MLTFINSSKSMEFEDEVMDIKSSTPFFLSESKELAEHILEMGYERMQEMMGVRDKLANLNFQRYVNLCSLEENLKRPAIFAYRGDVYEGLDAKTMDEKSLRFAQQHLCIISGLYGLLRPLDEIEPYRMEMSYKMKIPPYANLTQYWRAHMEFVLASEFLKQDSLWINLASEEYAAILKEVRKDFQWIDVKFLDESKGRYRFITLYGKRARGMMARYIMENKIDDISSLKEFDVGGYQFSPMDSSARQLVFKRAAKESS